MFVADAADLAKGVDRHALGRHHGADAVAGRARAAQLRGEVFADAFARELEQAERREGLDRRARAVLAQSRLQHRDDLVARGFARHVDEVAHDDPADVAQTNLARDLSGSFDVRLDDRVFEVAAAGELAAVDVDDGQRFGRLDDDRSARGQIDFGPQQLLNFLVDLEVAEELASVVVVLDPLDVLRAEQPHEVANFFVLFAVVDEHAVDLGVMKSRAAL